MSQIQRNRQKTTKNIQSVSKKQSVSSKTKTSSSNSTKNTVKKKTDLSQLDTQKQKDASLSFSAKSRIDTALFQGLSLRAVLQNLKQKSIKDNKKGKSGFVHLTQKEHETMKNTKFVNALGRPKKRAEEKQNVESMRFSLQEKNLLIAFAKKYGFSSWKECVKSIALECALEDSHTTFMNK